MTSLMYNNGMNTKGSETMTNTERKHWCQDRLMESMREKYSTFCCDPCIDEFEDSPVAIEMRKQMNRVAKLFGYDPLQHYGV